MILRPPISTRTDTPFPYTTLVRTEMTTLRLHRLTFVVLAVAGLGACTQDASSAQPTTSPSAQVVVQSADATPAALPRMTVHKTPTCGCRSEEHTSELQSLMRISYAVFCLKKKHNKAHITTPI